MDEQYLKEQQVKWGDFISECWEDEALAERFRKNPAGVMKEKGLDTEEGVTYKVVEAEPNVQYIVLPNAEKKEEINEALQLLAKGFLNAAEKNDGVVLPENVEVRIMQNTADMHYLVLPSLEGGLTEQELGIVAGGGTVAANLHVVGNVVAVANAAVVDNVAAANIAAGASVVVAAAGLVVVT
jgi:hypothetical protein